MDDYSELVKSLRKGEEWATKDGGIPVGLIYRLSQAADAIEELEKRFWASETDKDNLYEAVEYWRALSPKWIPVTERLPDFEGAVLCLRKSYIRRGFRHHEIMFVDENGFSNIDGIYAEPGNVTHWMPLPTPPKEETE